MKKKTIYLCGPIDSRCVADVPRSDIENGFKKWEMLYEQKGYNVINPITYGQEFLEKDPEGKIEDILVAELEMIRSGEIDVMLLMPRWHYSAGCLTEHWQAARRSIDGLAPEITFITPTYEMEQEADTLFYNYLKAEHERGK